MNVEIYKEKKKSFEKFQWNEYGVCNNPNLICITGKGNTVTIETAKYKEKWYFGYDLRSANTGTIQPVNYNDFGYDTEQKAILSAVAKAKVEADTPEQVFFLKNIAFDTLQLELF